jgi:hypothetical protein
MDGGALKMVKDASMCPELARYVINKITVNHLQG